MNSYIIVAAVDYSDLGNAALDAAITLSGLHANSEIHILHVDPRVGAPSEDIKVGSAALAHSDAALDKLENICNERLAHYREKHGEPPHVKRLSTHFRYGNPAKEIVALAADFGADIVLVGTHGRTGLSRMVLGSVAEKVVRTAPCQVLVIRDKKAVAAAGQLDEIEPLCADCKTARAQSGGQVVWCKRHSEPRHINTHRYTYGYENAGRGGVQSTRLGADS